MPEEAPEFPSFIIAIAEALIDRGITPDIIKKAKEESEKND